MADPKRRATLEKEFQAGEEMPTDSDDEDDFIMRAAKQKAKDKPKEKPKKGAKPADKYDRNSEPTIRCDSAAAAAPPPPLQHAPRPCVCRCRPLRRTSSLTAVSSRSSRRHAPLNNVMRSPQAVVPSCTRIKPPSAHPWPLPPTPPMCVVGRGGGVQRCVAGGLSSTVQPLC